jgi:hypothetical protein
LIVVDASVIAPALADDGDSGDRARRRRRRRRRRGERLCAPEILDLEVNPDLRQLLGAGKP